MIFQKGKIMNASNQILECEETFAAPSTDWSNISRCDLIRIWIVDDNGPLRDLMADMLNHEVDFECTRQFASPADLLEALSREVAPDIILLDIQMGEYNGLDAIRPIKSLAKGTHVLMFTTFAAPECRARAFREGASDFMLKRWSVEEIVRHIRQAVELGSVAGLLTTFLAKGLPVVSVSSGNAEMPKKTPWFERWPIHWRNLLRLSPS
jgi:DNA-binding NarL/FixJ family response regulator